jgi:hypothetical protein
MLPPKRWHGDEGGAAMLYASLPRLADRLAVSVGVELLRLAPGVSTEVDGKPGFNVAASVASAHQIIDAYKQRRRARARAHQTRIDVGGKRQWLRNRLRSPA